MRLKRLSLMVMIILGSGCHLICPTKQHRDLLREERRLKREYDWDKSGIHTPLNHIYTQYPKWLKEHDRVKMVTAVDASTQKIRELYEPARNLDLGRCIVWVHEAVGRFVSPQGSWVTGRMIGTRIVVSLVKDGDEYVIWSLAHEIFHFIFKELYGIYDENHDIHFPSVKGIIEQAREASRIILSPESIEAANQWVYVPWNKAD